MYFAEVQLNGRSWLEKAKSRKSKSLLVISA